MPRESSVRARVRFLGAGLPLAVLLAATFTACEDDALPEGVVEPADAYTAIVTWQAGEQEPILAADGDEQLPVIFIVAASGDNIDVGVQATVTSATSSEAIVRFADEAADGFDPRGDDAPVREDGVMLAIGAIPPASHSIKVEVDRYTTQDDPEQLSLTIRAQRAAPPDSDGNVAPRAVVTTTTLR